MIEPSAAALRGLVDSQQIAELIRRYCRSVDRITVWGRYLDRRSCRNERCVIDHRQVLRDFDEIRPATPLTPRSTAKRDNSYPSYAVFGVQPLAAPKLS